MNRYLFICVLSVMAALGAPFTQAQRQAAKLFDGKTFKGWEGNLALFRIEQGAIVGGTLKAPIARNEFLCTTAEYEDFEMRLKVKLVGDPAKANAGIQFHTQRIPNHHEVIGYQADMGQHYWGALYDESRRKKVLAAPAAEVLTKALKRGDWNDYVIRAEGKRVRLTLNGMTTVDYTETDEAIPQRGYICVQIHSGPASEAWYKDLALQTLK